MRESNIYDDIPSFEEKPFDLRGFIFKYLIRNWYLFVLFVILAGACGWAYLRYATPIYLVKGTMLIKSDQSTSNSGASEELILQDLGLMNGNKNVQNEIQILKSRTLMEEVVNHLSLNIRYFAEGRVKSTEIYWDDIPFQFLSTELDSNIYGKSYILQFVDDEKFLWGSKENSLETHNFGEAFVTSMGNFIVEKRSIEVAPNSKYIIAFQKPRQTVKLYTDKLVVKNVVEWSSVIELSMTDPLPDRAADIINNLIKFYNQAAIEDKNKVSKNTLTFIDDRLNLLSNELSEVEVDVERFKQRNQITTNAGAEVGLAYMELGNLDSDLTQLVIRKQIIEAVKKYILNDKNLNKPIPFSSGIDNVTLGAYITDYNELLTDRDRLEKSAGSSNPVLLETEKKLQVLRETILQSINNIVDEVDKNISVLEGKRLQVQSGIKEVPRKERELLEKERQQAIKEQLYLYLLQKKEETALSMAVTVANSRIIDAAQIASSKPVQPRKQTIYGLVLILGLGLPAGIIILRELLDDKIRSEDDINSRTDVPIIGVIGAKKTGEHIVVKEGSRSVLAEMFRLLRTNLQFVGSEIQGSKVILVTSSTSGEGKSFITANLGMAFALSNKKVILVGCDLRKPKLGKYLSPEVPHKGLSNYLINEAGISEIINPTEHNSNLFYINSGPMPPNPSELLINQRIEKLVDRLKEEFDLVLIDTPPVGLVADAFLLSKLTFSSLFVVRAGETKKGMLQIIDNIKKEGKLFKPGIVVNDFQQKWRQNYGYGYGYGYGYSYGYYEDDAKRSKWWKFW